MEATTKAHLQDAFQMYGTDTKCFSDGDWLALHARVIAREPAEENLRPAMLFARAMMRQEVWDHADTMTVLKNERQMAVQLVAPRQQARRDDCMMAAFLVSTRPTTEKVNQ